MTFWEEMLLDLELLATPNPASLAVVFLFGSVFGSFMNVVIYRTPLERSVVMPGSACTVCGTPLQWWHNIPILSYFLLGGRCSFCGTGYSSRYMKIELFTAVVAALLFTWAGGLGWKFVHAFALFFFCCTVFFTDLDHWIIPDQVNFAGAALGVVLSLFVPMREDFVGLLEPLPPVWVNNLASSVAGAAVGYLFFWAIQVVGTLLARQEAMGGGDVKFALLLGAFLGWKMALLAFLLSFFLGALIAIPMMVIRWGRSKEPVPFGTFMALAAIPVELWGPRILDFLMYWPDYLYVL